ncbi:hypothetical protein T4C_11969 [Trichinella pseudospiralis]|uniref:Uncharacterized protein n=1 Tax=Trichinella pseudospiralis TaxID=6337 RepID=A0A0V1KEY0_TRIPS|nr:hypothetical protein T4C_11969 [Trichinella pseudospiralis]
MDDISMIGAWNVSSLRIKILLNSDKLKYTNEATVSWILLTLGLVNFFCNFPSLLAILLSKKHRCTNPMNMLALLFFAYTIYDFGVVARNAVLLWHQYTLGHRIMQRNHCMLLWLTEQLGFLLIIDINIIIAAQFFFLIILNSRNSKLAAIMRYTLNIMLTGICVAHLLNEIVNIFKSNDTSDPYRCSLLSGTTKLNTKSSKMQCIVTTFTLILVYIILAIIMQVKFRTTTPTQPITDRQNENLHTTVHGSKFHIFMITCCFFCTTVIILKFITYSYLRTNRPNSVVVFMVRAINILPHLTGTVYFATAYWRCGRFQKILHNFFKCKLNICKKRKDVENSSNQSNDSTKKY